MPFCSKCSKDKSVSDFGRDRSAKTGRDYTCLECRRKYARGEVHKAAQRRSNLMREYGITVEAYELMLASQNGVCCICGGRSHDGKRLHVDHDHETGKVRGLLCGRCNRVVGIMGENHVFLSRMIEYLQHHAAVKS